MAPSGRYQGHPPPPTTWDEQSGNLRHIMCNFLRFDSCAEERAVPIHSYFAHNSLLPDGTATALVRFGKVSLPGTWRKRRGERRRAGGSCLRILKTRL